MITPSRRFGDQGEEMARKFLLRKGYKILGQNYQTRYGELDLVTKCKDRVVFVEVKTRRSYAYGLPEEAINVRKARHLSLMARWYMMKEKRKEEIFQIDLIAVDFYKMPPEIRHLESIVEG
jgi:putative endonuclease